MTDSTDTAAEPRYGATGITPDTPESLPEHQDDHTSILPAIVRDDPEARALISAANRNLGVLGFTEHGFRHVGLVSHIARNILQRLGHDRRHQDLAEIAGYLHDIGNVVSRHGHATTGALLAHTILTRLGLAPQETAIVMGAIGSHSDDHGKLGEPVDAISAALILADKSDVHRSRVRVTDPAEFDDHDRVNYATTSSFVRVDREARTITLELETDTDIATPMHYFELFLPRMVMCKRAAEVLECTFRITMNQVTML
ncbi:MAG: HD domain-containing protein [Thermomicrobiales bacterium]